MIPRSPVGLALVGLLVVGVLVGSLRHSPTRPPEAPRPPAPSVVEGGTARPGVSPGILGARLECTAAVGCTATWETGRLPVRVYTGATPATIDRSAPAAVATTGESVTVPTVGDGPTYAEVVADGDTRGPVVAARDLGLPTASVRDLGGYRTRSGTPLAWGHWFTTPDLRDPTPPTIAAVATLRLPSACPRATVSAGPDPLRRRTRRADARSLRSWATDGPVWIRCARRSGDWPVVLALTAATVPRETVVAAVLALQSAEGRPVDRAAVDRPLERVTARYGSFRQYLRTGLGLTDREVRAVRRAAVTATGGRAG